MAGGCHGGEDGGGSWWARDRHRCGDMMTIREEALPASSALVVE